MKTNAAVCYHPAYLGFWQGLESLFSTPLNNLGKTMERYREAPGEWAIYSGAATRPIVFDTMNLYSKCTIAHNYCTLTGGVCCWRFSSRTNLAPIRPIEPGCASFLITYPPPPPPISLSRVLVTIGNYKKHPLFGFSRKILPRQRPKNTPFP